jgi:hypothetical protein
MPASNYLVVKGCAGIGNRLFTLASALKYAEDTNRKIIVDWRDGVFAEPSKNAFDIFFQLRQIEQGNLTDVLQQKEKLSFYPKSLSKTLNESLYQNYRAGASNLLMKIPRFTRLRGRVSRLSEFWSYNPGNNFGKQTYSDKKAIQSLFSSNDIEYGHKLSKNIKQNVVMFADYWPGEVDKKHFEKIQVNETLNAKIEQAKKELGITNETIGIHVRSTDKKPDKEISSLITLLKKRITDSTSLFLATDNLEVEKLFKDTFKEKMLLLPKYYPDDTFNMHHAALKSGDYSHTEKLYEECLTDIYLLADCKIFYYQGNSSFSRLVLKLTAQKQESINWLTADGI